MQTVTMKPQEARTLKLHLERREAKIGDLRKIHAFLLGLDIAIKDYEREVTEAINGNPPRFDQQGRQLINRELSGTLAEINEKFSQPITFNAETADFELVHKIWKDVESWPADSENREIAIGIDDAMKAAANGTINQDDKS